MKFMLNNHATRGYQTFSNVTDALRQARETFPGAVIEQVAAGTYAIQRAGDLEEIGSITPEDGVSAADLL